MNKKGLVERILADITVELQVARAAALATYEAATHEESKPENEYDTRGLEASYLAGAQSKRVLELEEAHYYFAHLKPRTFKEGDAIGPTALVQLEHEGRESVVFLVSKGGGRSLQFEGQSIQTVTPTSPLGEALAGLKIGDVAIIDFDGRTKEYDVLSVQ